MAAKQTKRKALPQSDRRNVWLLVLITLLTIGSIVMFMPPDEKINQGLDIQGGLSVVLTAKSADGAPVTSDEMDKSRSIIESRVNALGASEATVQIQGGNQVLVQIPGLSDPQQALNTIGKTGKLEFARLDSFTDDDVKSQIDSGNLYTQGSVTDEFGNQFPTENPTPLTVDSGTYTPLITGANIASVSVGRATQAGTSYSVNLDLDSAGTQAFAQATTDLAPTKGKIVIILDGEVQSAPAVQSVIPNGQVSITGNYTLSDAQSLQTVLESGSLPVSFEYSQSQVVGPTLGQDALRSGVLVAAIGLLLVILYLLFFYRGLGIITAGAMGVFAVLYLGILATLSAFGLFSLSLAGIAGIVLTIGMAADSSILTMERFREEIRMGRTVRAASITGVRHAIQTSIDADLVTMVSALALFFLASASVKGFGMTLALGIICDIMMMLIFKAPIIRLMAPRTISKHPGFWGIKESLVAAGTYEALTEANAAEGATAGAAGEAQPTLAAAQKADAKAAIEVDAKPAVEADAKAAAKAAIEAGAADGGGSEGTAIVKTAKSRRREEKAAKASEPHGHFLKHDINFLGHRRVFLTIAAVMILSSFVIVGVKGLNFGIEFIGGTSVTFHGTGDIGIDDMRSAFSDAGEPDAVIQTTTADGNNGFLVRTTTTSAEEAAASAQQVASKFGLSTDSFEVTTIGPDWGASVIQSSLIAFFVSIILIIIYIAFRFEYKMGVTAIVALLHDLILVMGIYALVGREVNPNTIAALLTILGYSLYDSVVVFHRINDNMKETDFKCTFMTMANHSINQVIVRTLNTTLSSLIPVLAMLLFGGETLRDFAFAMTVGLVCGSYSSIAIAAPLYGMWKTREPQYAKLVRKYGPEVGIFDFAHPNIGTALTKEAQAAAKKGLQAAPVATASLPGAGSGGKGKGASAGASGGKGPGGPGASGTAVPGQGSPAAQPAKPKPSNGQAKGKQPSSGQAKSNHHYRKKRS